VKSRSAGQGSNHAREMNRRPLFFGNQDQFGQHNGRNHNFMLPQKGIVQDLASGGAQPSRT